jgi:hypothetical protein
MKNHINTNKHFNQIDTCLKAGEEAKVCLDKKRSEEKYRKEEYVQYIYVLKRTFCTDFPYKQVYET